VARATARYMEYPSPTDLTINRELGEPNDAPAKVVFDVLWVRCEKSNRKARIPVGSESHECT
jgi:hypothetical protein